MDIIISIFLGYRNGIKAKNKGYNNIAWALLSIGAFFLGEVLGWLLMFGLFYNGSYSQDNVLVFITSNPIRVITALFCGFGGYLLVKFRLSKLPDISSKVE